MALITLTLEDTPSGGIAVHSRFMPAAVGGVPTPAQALAIQIMGRPENEPGAAPVADQQALREYQLYLEHARSGGEQRPTAQDGT
ncbi:hypothetical protein [Chitiniphilus shinanonensis]|uniref:hypothetical protein n=1 Tax=Chitiniphilus shinanonensis TaxID=553088 RepID=UPI00302C035D